MIDFISDNIYILLILAGVVAQWVKSQKEAREQRQFEEARRRALAEQAVEEYEFEGGIDLLEPQYPRREAIPPPLPSALPDKTLIPPSVEDFSSELARQQRLLEQVSELKRSKKEKRNAPLPPAHSYDRQAKPVSKRSITRRLNSRSELRQAIVLKEVLDKPLALR
ncbi:hypothetical protein [Luteolibacter sp. AS25]|uniref:hypothetical protein n=1 Tax=Luteolibacter sp. AS25 TaxID=3135776 RepID=UPI00398B522F